MVVSQEESPPLPRNRRPVRAEDGEDVNSTWKGHAAGRVPCHDQSSPMPWQRRASLLRRQDVTFARFCNAERFGEGDYGCIYPTSSALKGALGSANSAFPSVLGDVTPDRLTGSSRDGSHERSVQKPYGFCRARLG